MRRVRCCLSVPGSSPEKMAKAAGLEVDQVILDLEDAVAPADKAAARDHVARALRELEFRAPTVSVRVNGRRSAFFAEDLTLVEELRPDCVVLPKVEDEADPEPLPVPVQALVETARGLVAVERIAQAPQVEALVFGPGDLAASLGAPQLTIGEGDWGYALARVAVAAKAFGRQAIDGPHVRLGDTEGLLESAARSRALGYDGKWAIHPAQIEPLRAAYTPSDAEVERAERIVAVAASAARLDGEMVDEATRKMAEAVLARARPAV